MKTLLLLLPILLNSQPFSSDFSWIDSQINAITATRKGIEKETLNQSKNPFIFLTQKSQQKSSSLSKQVTPKKQTILKNKKSFNQKFLLTLLLNKSAMINGNWYKVGETIDGYRLKSFNANSVLLTKKRTELLLSINSENIPSILIHK